MRFPICSNGNSRTLVWNFRNLKLCENVDEILGKNWGFQMKKTLIKNGKVSKLNKWLNGKKSKIKYY